MNDQLESQMPVDPQCQALLDQIAAANAPDIWTMSPDEVRAGARRTRSSLPPGPEVGGIADYLLDVPDGTIRMRAYSPVDRPIGVIVYLHGGGWVAGSIEDSDGPNRMLANATSCKVLAVDYRLAPEYPFPIPVEDSFAALLWAAEHMRRGTAADLPLIIAGDSAGANIAAAVAMIARDMNGPPISLQLLLYPATDAGCATESYRLFATGFLPTASSMKWFWNHYAPTDSQKFHPHASVLRASNLAYLPPALIQTAEFDPLRDEGEAYGFRLRGAGVPVTIDRREGMIHGYMTFAQILDGGAAAVAAIAGFVRGSLQVPQHNEEASAAGAIASR